MEELRRGAEQLGRIEKEVKEQVNLAIEAGEEIDEQVDMWLEEALSISANMKTNWLVDETAGSTRANILFSGNHQLRKFDEDVLKVRTLVDDIVARGKSILCVCFPVDPKGIELVWRDGFVDFKSRRPAFDRVMEGLRDEKIGIIGMSGLGGIGKTKMVLDIGKKAKEEKLFDQVVMATVTQNPNIRNIQGMFADMLNLTFKEVTDTGRANEIRARIEKESKVLVILDDVWNKINVESIQVPSSSDRKSCKILLTTRREEVCVEMGCNLIVHLDALKKDEALALFSEYAELRDQKSRLVRSKAKNIVKECGGLPLAIVVVGSALRDKSLEDYEDAWQRLSSSNFVDVESADKEIYSCLKLSYDYLEDEDTKKCFLLCSLYPEDKEVEVEELTRCAYGQWLFQNVDSIDEARKRMFSSIKILENACLLNTARDALNYFSSPLGSLLGSYFLFHPCVKMHDMVRDVALWINKVNGAPFFELTSLKELQRKHMNEKVTAFYLKICSDWQFSSKLEYPNLKILMVSGRFSSAGCMTVQGNFLEKTSALQVLYLSSDCMRLPVSLQNLHNLRSLFLFAYPNLIRNSDLSIIGKLKNIEILHFGLYEGLKVLPEWIGELYNLRLLDLSRYRDLEEIPCNLLSRLAKLEELYMPYVRNTESWCDDYVSDLMFLPRLTVFSGWFMGLRSLPLDIKFGNLERYYIMCMLSDPDDDITSFDSDDEYLVKDDYRRTKRLGLDYVNEFSIKVFEQLLPTVECLQIWGPMQNICNICPQLDNAGFQNLRALILWNSESLEYLIDYSDVQTAAVFPNLVELELFKMRQLQMICHGPPPPTYLEKLRRARIIQCPKLRNIVPDMFPIGSHPQLDRLVIKSCDELTYVYEVEAEAFEQTKGYLQLLPCPTVMELRNLHKLQSIWKRTHHLEKQELIDKDSGIVLCNMFLQATLRTLTSLTEIKIHDCDQLREIFPFFQINYQDYDGQLSNMVELERGSLPKLKCILNGLQQNYCLAKLRKIYLERCDALSSLFTSTLAKSLLKLRSLCLVECRGLETIIQQDNQDEALASSDSQKIFQELEDIFIISCDKLKRVLPNSFVAQGLPNLRRISIKNCAELVEVFENEENLGEQGEIILNNLHSLELVDLPRLVSSLTSSWHLIFPSLAQLKIAGVTFKHTSDHLLPTREQPQEEDWKMNNGILPIKAPQSLVDIWEVEIVNYLDAQEVFDVDEAQQPVLTQLGVLKVGNMPNLKYIWKGPVRFVRLTSLREIAAYKCASIRSLLSLSMIQNLPSLKSLRLEDCPELEYVFHDDTRSESGDDDESVGLNEHSQTTWFPNLEKIHVEECDKLKFLFPLSSAHHIPLLKEVYVRKTPQLEQLFREDEEGYEGDDEEIMLPSLQHIKSICIESCNKLKSILPIAFVAQGLPKLESIYIGECLGLEQVFGDKEHPILSGHLDMNNLRSLKLVNVPRLTRLLPSNWQLLVSSLSQLQLTAEGQLLEKLHDWIMERHEDH